MLETYFQQGRCLSIMRAARTGSRALPTPDSDKIGNVLLLGLALSPTADVVGCETEIFEEIPRFLIERPVVSRQSCVSLCSAKLIDVLDECAPGAHPLKLREDTQMVDVRGFVSKSQ